MWVSRIFKSYFNKTICIYIHIYICCWDERGLHTNNKIVFAIYIYDNYIVIYSSTTQNVIEKYFTRKSKQNQHVNQYRPADIKTKSLTIVV